MCDDQKDQDVIEIKIPKQAAEELKESMEQANGCGCGCAFVVIVKVDP